MTFSAALTLFIIHLSLRSDETAAQGLERNLLVGAGLESEFGCEPASLCDFFEFLLYQLLFGLMSSASFLHVFVLRPLMKKTVERYRTRGVPTEARVLDSYARPCRSKDAPVKLQTYEYAALVEFEHESRITRKWVLIREGMYQSIRSTKGERTLTVYCLPGYPKSATIGDSGVLAETNCTDTFLMVLLLFLTVLVHVWLFALYASHHDSLRSALPGLLALLLFLALETGLMHLFSWYCLVKPKFDSWLLYSADQQARHYFSLGREHPDDETTPLVYV